MKRLTYLIALGLLLLLALALCRPSAGATSEPEMPTVEFLGEGPETYTTDPDFDFIVKTKNTQGQPWRFKVETGPEYRAKRGERVWSVSAGAEAPMRVFEETIVLGNVEAGCTVDYVVIDDDNDTRRVDFSINGINVLTSPQGMVSYGRLEVSSGGQLSVTSADSVGLWWGTRCEPPSQYFAYLPVVAPPAGAVPAACEGEILSAAMVGQSATLEFQPWPGIDRDFGIWGPNEILSLTATREVSWAVSRAADQYHYLPVASSYNLTGVYPWPENGTELWNTDPVTLLAIPDYHIRIWFEDASGVRCEVSGWVQWDPPEDARSAELSAKPAGLVPVFVGH